MKIKIFALTHKKFEVPQDKMYQPLQVGRELKKRILVTSVTTRETTFLRKTVITVN